MLFHRGAWAEYRPWKGRRHSGEYTTSMESERTLLQEAEDPRTLPRRLHEVVNLSRGDEVRPAVAVHPNAPPALLGMLARWHPEAVLRNPALPLVLLEDPRWADKLLPETALTMLRAEDVPAFLLSTFAGRPGPVGQAARLHIGLTGECGPDWEGEAREALWEAAGLSEKEESRKEESRKEEPFPARLLSLDLVAAWLVGPLAAHGNASVRRAVARSPQAPQDLLTLLRRAGSTSDLGGPAPPDPALPASDLERLARGGPWAKLLAARHPNTPPVVLEGLAGGGDETLARHLVRNPATPAALRESLAVSLGPVFRRASARDPETPPAALARLAADATRDVRWMAAWNPHTPPDALAALAGDADARVRQGVGRNAAAPAALLAALAGDTARWVRLAAARHPDTPPAALADLAEDADEEVRQSVARRDTLRRPRPPAPVRETDPPPARIRVAPRVVDAQEAGQALGEAAASGGGLAKAAVLANPDVSPGFLTSGVAELFWPCRLAVARNPAISLLALESPEAGDALALLARDGNRLVRAARAAIQRVEARP